MKYQKNRQFDGILNKNLSRRRRRVVVTRKSKEGNGKESQITLRKVKNQEPVFIVEKQEMKKAIEKLQSKKRVVDLRNDQASSGELIKKNSNYEASNDVLKKDNVVLHSKTVSFKEETLRKNIKVKKISKKQKIDFLKREDFRIRKPKKLIFAPRATFAIFTLLCFLFAFSIRSFAIVDQKVNETKETILGNANMAYEYASSATNSLGENNYDLAEYKFKVAAERFFSSKQKIDDMGHGITRVLTIIPGGTQVTAGENLLMAGGNFATAGEYIAKSIEPFKESGDVFEAIKKNEDEIEKTIELSKDEQSLTDALAVSSENLKIALDKIKSAEKNLTNVNVDKLPKEISTEVGLIKENIPEVRSSLEYFLSYADFLLILLGHDNFKRYLIIFQNNSEIRATGGFIGTYGLMDLNEGKVTHLKVEGPYHLDGQLRQNIISPEPLHLINPRFFMRDANWFPDFETSAKKVAEFHEKAGGPSVDGVISINATVLVELLKLTGPIDFPEYELQITAENFMSETQREVEISYDKELNRPKKFISDLIPKVIEKVLKQEKKEWLKSILLFTSLLEKKEIMLCFFDQNQQKVIQEMGYAGEIKKTGTDYLNVVVSNIGGGKTDTIINQKADLTTDILPDGSIINTLVLSRTHNGSVNDFWTRVKNVAYLRFYVPEGSELIESSGFDKEFFNLLKPNEEGAIPDKLVLETEGNSIIHNNSETRIYNESQKTVFGNFLSVEAGMSKSVTLKYKLPFKAFMTEKDPVTNYVFLFQKQSGANPIEVHQTITYPQSYFVTWDYFESAKIKKSLRKVESDFLLDRDKTFGVVFSR